MPQARLENVRAALCDNQFAPPRSTQLPTNQNHAVPTCEYQTDSSSKQPGHSRVLLFSLSSGVKSRAAPCGLDRSTHISAASVKSSPNPGLPPIYGEGVSLSTPISSREAKKRRRATALPKRELCLVSTWSRRHPRTTW